ncbi:probable receptor-like protein kinase At5g39030 [Solanum tuberosum]|uniref:probable receptor-like protein kinase At5g39030 n=1 Tax=Solanum tuberosum TaxID=4113 RepID=UPI00073A1FFD|nr:PREDICTED: probable receptor-like protein kinase At5g39030 [Solanum tuberosum]
MVATGAVLFTVGLLVLLFFFREKILRYKCLGFWESNAEDHQNIEAFLKNYGSYAPKRYNYSEVKRMTSCFKNKLGQGGYGSVYKGTLQNGNHVAVKVLNGLKGNGEEFINEVASISRTSHVNITDPSNRPSMSKVVEMLEGKLDSLQMPPKPYLYSPTGTETDPSNRPSMSKVVEMLEGKLDSLQMPPKPYLYSPTRTEVDLSVLELAQS